MFSLSKKSNARTGYITTPNGVIKTPAFIFCGTKGALKSCSTVEAKNNNTQIILTNTFTTRFTNTFTTNFTTNFTFTNTVAIFIPGTDRQAGPHL